MGEALLLPGPPPPPPLALAPALELGLPGAEAEGLLEPSGDLEPLESPLWELLPVPRRDREAEAQEEGEGEGEAAVLELAELAKLWL